MNDLEQRLFAWWTSVNPSPKITMYNSGRWEIGWEHTPQQIGQPLAPEFSQDDAAFLRSIKVKVEEEL